MISSLIYEIYEVRLSRISCLSYIGMHIIHEVTVSFLLVQYWWKEEKDQKKKEIHD